MYVSVCLHACMCTMFVAGACRSQRGRWISWSTDGLSYQRVLGSKAGPLQEQLVLGPAEPALQSLQPFLEDDCGKCHGIFRCRKKYRQREKYSKSKYSGKMEETCSTGNMFTVSQVQYWKTSGSKQYKSPPIVKNQRRTRLISICQKFHGSFKPNHFSGH